MKRRARNIFLTSRASSKKNVTNYSGASTTKSDTSNKKTKPSNVVYLGRIPDIFEEKEVKAYLSQFGKVLDVRLGRKGYGFVKFENSEVACFVAKKMNGYTLIGQQLVCRVVPRDKIHPDLFSQLTNQERERTEKTILVTEITRLRRQRRSDLPQASRERKKGVEEKKKRILARAAKLSEPLESEQNRKKILTNAAQISKSGFRIAVGKKKKKKKHVTFAPNTKEI